MSLRQITRRVLSYCAMPQELTDNEPGLRETTCDSYIDWHLPEAFRENWSPLDHWIANEYPELVNTEFLIDIDY